MRTPSLLIASALVLTPLAKADKFWLEPKTEQSQVAGSLPATIDGVLLDEEGGQYHIRVVGGELWLDKDSVHAIDKDRMTVASIERSEKQEQKALAAATEERIAAQQRPTWVTEAREASASRRYIDQVEPELIDTVEASFDGSAYTPVYDPVYDPVIGRALPVGISDAQLMRELEMAYERTGNHTYIKMVRKLRRLR